MEGEADGGRDRERKGEGCGFRVHGSGFRVQGWGLRVEGRGSRVEDEGWRVERTERERKGGRERVLY